MASKTKRILVISDLHVGSVVGLWPDGFAVEGGGIYVNSVFGAWLLSCWEDMLAKVRAMHPKPLLVINGDVVQGVSPKDGMLITNVVSRQTMAAEELLRPLVRACSGLYMIRGTEWHEGRSAEHVEHLAKMLGAIPKTTADQYTHWELYLGAESHVLHFAHHVGVSSVPHYEATVPLRDGLMLLAELHRFYGTDTPDLDMVVRSHRHRYIYVDAAPDFQVVVTPGWQLRTAFAYKKATAMLPQIGYVLIEATEGELIARKHVYPLPPLRVEQV